MVNKRHQTLTELTSEVETYLKSISYTETRIKFYQNGWKLIKQFMLENSIEFFEANVSDDFLGKVLGNRSYKEISRKEKDLIRCTNVLSEFQATGSIKFRSTLKSYLFEGEIGKLILGYLSHRKLHGMSDDSLNNNKLYLHRFLEFLNSNQVLSLSALDKQHILHYINGLGYYSKSTIHCMLSSLRGS